MLKMISGALIALAIFASSAFADEPVVLKTGELLLGQVTSVGPETIEFQAHFPKREKLTLPRASISDASLWRILSVRVKVGDGKARLTLGRWAEGRGLFAAALVEYRRASEVDADKAVAIKSAKRVEDRLAAMLFDQGEEQYALDRPLLARQYFTLLVERYPQSPQADVARKRIQAIEAVVVLQAKATVNAPRKPVRTLASWNTTLERATRLAKRASKYEQGAVHGSTANKQVRSLKSAVRLLEDAWEELQALGAEPEGVAKESSALAGGMRVSIKRRLVDTYLELGTAFLLRRSLSQADAYCQKACLLAPKQKDSHELHKLLIEARLAEQWGAQSLARVSGR